MKLNSGTLIIVLTAALIGFGLWFTLSDVEPARFEEGENLRYSRKGIREAKNSERKKTVRTLRVRKESQKIDSKSVAERPKLDDLDESDLSELEKAVLAQIRAALDSNNLKALRRALARFSQAKSKGGLGGDIPKVLRQHALTALGWFGGAAAADLVEFMADVDPEIEEDAFAKFELALDDWEMGDRERSDILVTALKALTDTERIDSLMMNLNNMRNSVKSDTILTILETGSDASKAVMREQYEFYTDSVVADEGAGSDDAQIFENVNKWKSENPDDPGDEEFYGPQKEN